MIERLEKLLSYSLEDVLAEGTLLIELLRLWSTAFNDKKPCSTCRPEHVKYYAQLQKEGREIFKRMAENKYVLKGHLNVHGKGVFTNANIDDNISKALLKQHPSLISAFASYPENWNDEVIQRKQRTKKVKQNENIDNGTAKQEQD